MRDARSALELLDTVVLGVSPDPHQNYKSLLINIL
jgi:hypothetical protein